MVSRQKKLIGTQMGPGGKCCPCCFPPPGKRKGIYRKAKKVDKKRAIKEGIEDHESNIEEQIMLEIEFEQEMFDMYEDMLMWYERREEEDW